MGRANKVKVTVCFMDNATNVESGGTPRDTVRKTRAKGNGLKGKARTKERAKTATDSNRQEDSKEAKVVGCHRG